MMWWILLVLSGCTHEQCRNLSDWIEYTYLEGPIEPPFVCEADQRTHTLMNVARCEDEGVYRTCFRCRERRQMCGRYKCGGRDAGTCVHGQCRCVGDRVLNVQGVCEHQSQ